MISEYLRLHSSDDHFSPEFRGFLDTQKQRDYPPRCLSLADLLAVMGEHPADHFLLAGNGTVGYQNCPNACS